MTGRRGQALVEICVLVPLVAAVAGALALALAAAGAGIAVEHALDAGLIAAGRGDDPVRAARASLPAGLRAVARVDRTAGELRVRIDPGGPFGPLAGLAHLPGGADR
jgi:hypothetical protein